MNIEPFSTTDIFYTKATDCTINVSSGCETNNDDDQANCECKYRENVDKLNALKMDSGTSKQAYMDINIEHTAAIMSNIGLGIGIASMLYIMYK
jgi:hypothetical protein